MKLAIQLHIVPASPLSLYNFMALSLDTGTYYLLPFLKRSQVLRLYFFNRRVCVSTLEITLLVTLK
jgi:hypothetical protein